MTSLNSTLAAAVLRVPPADKINRYTKVKFSLSGLGASDLCFICLEGYEGNKQATFMFPIRIAAIHARNYVDIADSISANRPVLIAWHHTDFIYSNKLLTVAHSVCFELDDSARRELVKLLLWISKNVNLPSESIYVFSVGVLWRVDSWKLSLFHDLEPRYNFTLSEVIAACQGINKDPVLSALFQGNPFVYPATITCGAPSNIIHLVYSGDCVTVDDSRVLKKHQLAERLNELVSYAKILQEVESMRITKIAVEEKSFKRPLEVPAPEAKKAK